MNPYVGFFLCALAFYWASLLARNLELCRRSLCSRPHPLGDSTSTHLVAPRSPESLSSQYPWAIHYVTRYVPLCSSDTAGKHYGIPIRYRFCD